MNLPDVLSCGWLTFCALFDGNSGFVGVIGSLEIEVGNNGGDGDTGVTGKGDTSRRIDFLMDSGIGDEV